MDRARWDPATVHAVTCVGNKGKPRLETFFCGMPLAGISRARRAQLGGVRMCYVGECGAGTVPEGIRGPRVGLACICMHFPLPRKTGGERGRVETHERDPISVDLTSSPRTKLTLTRLMEEPKAEPEPPHSLGQLPGGSSSTPNKYLSLT